MSNKLDDLRTILFETIRDVKAGKMPLDRAKAVGELTQVVVNSAKVEVDFIRATDGKGIGTGFLGQQPGELPTLPEPAGKPPKPDKPVLPPGITGVHTHRVSDVEPEAK